MRAVVADLSSGRRAQSCYYTATYSRRASVEPGREVAKAFARRHQLALRDPGHSRRFRLDVRGTITAVAHRGDVGFTRRRANLNGTFRKSADSEPVAAFPEDQPDFTTMPRLPSSPFASDGKDRAHTSARSGAHGLRGYQTWWRSGRDSNSRTGYARYGISGADSQNRRVLSIVDVSTSI